MGIHTQSLEGKRMTAKVYKGGKQYSNYESFAKAAGYPDAASIKHGSTVSAYAIEGAVVKLLAKGNHGSSNETIYVAETNAGKRFLIGEPGLKNIASLSEITLSEATIDELLAEVKKRTESSGRPIQKVKAAPVKTRDDIVEEAKQDVKELELYGRSLGVRSYGNSTFQGKHFVPEFHVNREKQVVTALVKGPHTGKIFEKGFAKCDPSDCFNEYIGKAIALRRALGLEVPTDYLNAPKPEGKQAGDIIATADFTPRILRLIDNTTHIEMDVTAHIGSITANDGKVIDDSARY